MEYLTPLQKYNYFDKYFKQLFKHLHLIPFQSNNLITP